MSTLPTSLVLVCKLRSVLILSERTVSGGGGACSGATPTDDSPSAMHSILAQLTLLVDKAKKKEKSNFTMKTKSKQGECALEPHWEGESINVLHN